MKTKKQNRLTKEDEPKETTNQILAHQNNYKKMKKQKRLN